MKRLSAAIGFVIVISTGETDLGDELNARRGA